MPKLPNLIPNTRRSLFADDVMIYSESSIIRSDLIQSNLKTSMDDLTLFNSNQCIILSCTKSVRVLFERKKSNRLKRQDVTYNGQVIPSSSSVKFLGITFDSHFRSHFRTVATLARHRLLKLNSIFSSTCGPSTSTLIRSLFDYGAPAICLASPDIQLSWERIQTHFISRVLSIPSFIHNIHPSIHPCQKPVPSWYRRAMPHNRGVHDYIDNHTHDKRNIRGSRTTPLELIRN